MTYTKPTSKTRINTRYSIARLKPLQILLDELKLNMEHISANTADKSLKKGIQNFIKEMTECNEKIKTFIAGLLLLFPVTVLSHKPKEIFTVKISCPFECASIYESKIINLFRIVLNDYKVIKEVRDAVRTQFNEVLCAFLKIKLISNVSTKSLNTKGQLF